LSLIRVKLELDVRAFRQGGLKPVVESIIHVVLIICKVSIDHKADLVRARRARGVCPHSRRGKIRSGSIVVVEEEE